MEQNGAEQSAGGAIESSRAFAALTPGCFLPGLPGLPLQNTLFLRAYAFQLRNRG